MKRVSWYTLAWASWVVFFLVVEGIAVVRGPVGSTFSEHWWSVFHTREKVPTWARVALGVVQIGAGVWLVGHLTFGIWS